jgi:hypothetical protein
MFGKRLVVGVSVATLGVAAVGDATNALGQPAQTEEPGLVYGGERFGQSSWLRLSSSRTSIAEFELPWAINGKRCSDGVGYYSLLLTGAQWDEFVAVREDGTFRTKVVDDYRHRRNHFVETQIVKGTVSADRVVGTIEGKLRRTRANGQVVRCTFGPQRWVLVN